jgi:hypothetical protein
MHIINGGWILHTSAGDERTRRRGTHSPVLDKDCLRIEETEDVGKVRRDLNPLTDRACARGWTSSWPRTRMAAQAR